MSSKPEETRVASLRLICLAPPAWPEEASVEFGLQDKQQVVHAGHRQDDDSIRYDLTVQVTRSREAAALRFRGPYVHGTAAVPFLYLSWRRKEPAGSPWLRRLKIVLASITWEQIEALDRLGGGVLEARVSGAGSATAPLLGGGWTPRATPRA
jgi:hypothetical protein